MFIAALFTVARTWKQPKCSSTDEWIKKMRHIYAMEYYSAIKRNEIEFFVVRWMDLESVIQSEVSQKRKNIPYANTYIGNLKKEKKEVMKHLGARREKDRDVVENGLEDTGRAKGKVGQSERVAWTYIHYQM